ncbi:hypothetical protein PIIN_02762 [Serendipita indica DSM 11827]|uniref:Chromosome transmission fidelity protein 8 n=1 Tax=Serendipita indica (strain DSM 11827) TaxID=1109443 RepID=G4TC46_SERID|nr:hypothetical protein PIIN_02762 [Serendipita indica DSM 11827]
MIIPVRLPSQVPSPDHALPPAVASIGFNELVLLELQGSIEIEGDYAGETIGMLDMSIESKPTLRIGHHLLEGKLTGLPKPLAVLKSNKTAEPDNEVSFDIVSIIRKKIVFSKRPSPVMDNVAKDELQEPSKRKRAA